MKNKTFYFPNIIRFHFPLLILLYKTKYGNPVSEAWANISESDLGVFPAHAWPGEMRKLVFVIFCLIQQEWSIQYIYLSVTVHTYPICSLQWLKKNYPTKSRLKLILHQNEYKVFDQTYKENYHSTTISVKKVTRVDTHQYFCRS